MEIRRQMPHRFKSRAILIIVKIGVLAGFAACGSSSGAISIDQYKPPAEATSGDYTIGVGDVLNIQVWDQPQMSGKIKVRTDGRISVPFVSDVAATGKT